MYPKATPTRSDHSHTIKATPTNWQATPTARGALFRSWHVAPASLRRAGPDSAKLGQNGPKWAKNGGKVRSKLTHIPEGIEIRATGREGGRLCSAGQREASWDGALGQWE